MECVCCTDTSDADVLDRRRQFPRSIVIWIGKYVLVEMWKESFYFG